MVAEVTPESRSTSPLGSRQGPCRRAVAGRILAAAASNTGCGGGGPGMADLAYALLLIGGFALLLLMMRGLQRL
jgi:hypothetical protein